MVWSLRPTGTCRYAWSDGASFEPRVTGTRPLGIESELEQTLQNNEHQREAAEILDLAAEAEA